MWYSLKYAFTTKEKFIAILPQIEYERSPYLRNNPKIRGQIVLGWLKWRVYLHIIKHSKSIDQ